MIVRVAERKKQEKGPSFSQLAHYAAKDDPRSVRLHNFQSIHAVDGVDLEIAIAEVENAHRLYRGSAKNLTYHFVISFALGEHPRREILDKIEHSLVKSIGLQDHPRVSAVHDDTDHLHLHVVISKVHPRSGRCVTPFRDFKKLGKAASRLERKFGLLAVEGRGKVTAWLPHRAAALEAHSGIESLYTWIRRVALPELKAVLSEEEASWSTLHQALARHDLLMKRRGAGLVIAARQHEKPVKASKVDRALSFHRLQEQLGPWQEPGQSVGTTKPDKRYRPQPLAFAQSKSPADKKLAERIWNAYQSTQSRIDEERTKRVTELRKKYREDFARITRFYKGQQEGIREALDPAPWKEEMSTFHWWRERRLLSKLRADTIAAQAKVRMKYPAKTWRAYLQANAEKGSQDHLKVLRMAGGAATTPLKASIEYDQRVHRVYEALAKPKVRKSGMVEYRIGRDRLYDDGRRLHFSSPTPELAIAALEVVAAKGYDVSTYKLNGPPEFLAAANGHIEQMRQVPYGRAHDPSRA